MFSAFTRQLMRPAGWFNLALGIAGLALRDWLWGSIFLVLGIVLLTQGYRVLTVLGVRLPWVKAKDPDPS
jgi:uncharacterized membrane protein YdbT with pleckstrin-like domain